MTENLGSLDVTGSDLEAGSSAEHLIPSVSTALPPGKTWTQLSLCTGESLYESVLYYIFAEIYIMQNTMGGNGQLGKK